MDTKKAVRRKYHFIYKTTCSVNQRYYIGMHSTDDLNDGYLGSGTYLSRSIRKHGREHFSMEILELLPSRVRLKEREREIVTEQVLADPLCMNLKVGGEGGFTLSKSQYKARNRKCTDALLKRFEDPEFRQGFVDEMTARNTKMWTDDPKLMTERAVNQLKHRHEGGWNHAQETKDKIATQVAGAKNGMSGLKWMYNMSLKLSKRFDKHEIFDALERGWLYGRRMKFT